jgi:transposase
VTEWPSYNRSLVRRGEILFAYDFLNLWWDIEIDEMNEKKEGRKYRYPDSLILVIGYIRVYLHLPYRQTEGIIKATAKSLPNHPSYSQINRRINNLDIDSSRSSSEMDGDNDDLIIAVDSTGIKVTNRGQWRYDKWNTQNKKKGYLKIHVAVNIKTKEILALEVTDERVHDGKVMDKLIEHVLKNSNKGSAIKIKSVLADGAYDSNENFKCLEENKNQPGIKVRKNSIISSKNAGSRNKEVRSQKDFPRWKKKRKYGKRWVAETAFSSLKRTYGEYVSATRFQNMVKEMALKVSLYNLLRRLS